MLTDLHPLIYFGGVTLVAAVAYVWIYSRVTLFKQKRVERIENLVKDPESMAAIPTDVLSDKQERKDQRKVIKGVKSRFTVIRRTLVITIFVVWFMAMLFPFIGNIPSTMLSIVVAVSTAVVGIAARPLVENMISGIVISFSNQLRVGDTLKMDEQYGTVEDISITHTKIKTWDWKRYVIPNSRMLNKEFVNLTLNDSLIWAYLELTVSYEADLEEVEELAKSIARESEYYNGQEEPQFWTMRLDRDHIMCWVAAWVDSPGDAWSIKSEIRTKLAIAFRERGIPAHMTNLNMKQGSPRPSPGIRDSENTDY